ncbi:hypothetical protein CAOG_00813 [Capsaspora owczarzaki ATCC 30864]|uniref:hypothetical protein n=1 Tax=Capsaspora owczarzaki (strain ATCC 30864) TaxID=595528 RepID=UPI0003524030|nr:hypothetical protein CAOG_00813 [Capsaspora owczarzaki ATCC 30864]|eukprot:XP_004365684.2 hypothetical protein CAOG_00813 [Capsaspora owczarzaki ATCC 30864]
MAKKKKSGSTPAASAQQQQQQQKKSESRRGSSAQLIDDENDLPELDAVPVPVPVPVPEASVDATATPTNREASSAASSSSSDPVPAEPAAAPDADVQQPTTTTADKQPPTEDEDDEPPPLEEATDDELHSTLQGDQSAPSPDNSKDNKNNNDDEANTAAADPINGEHLPDIEKTGAKRSFKNRRGARGATISISRDAAVVVAARRAAQQAEISDSDSDSELATQPIPDSEAEATTPTATSATLQEKRVVDRAASMPSLFSRGKNPKHQTISQSSGLAIPPPSDADRAAAASSSAASSASAHPPAGGAGQVFSEPSSPTALQPAHPHILAHASLSKATAQSAARGLQRQHSLQQSSPGSPAPANSSSRLLEIANLFISSMNKSTTSLPGDILSDSVEVHLMEAQDLPVKDPNTQGSPYCKIRCGSQKYRTKTAARGDVPQWREWLTIDLHASHSTMMDVMVLDHEYAAASAVGSPVQSSSSVIGKVSFDLSTLPADTWIEKWLDLVNAPSGRLHFKFRRNVTRAAGADSGVSTPPSAPSETDGSETEASAEGRLARARQSSIMRKYISMWRSQYPGHEGVQNLATDKPAEGDGSAAGTPLDLQASGPGPLSPLATSSPVQVAANLPTSPTTKSPISPMPFSSGAAKPAELGGPVAPTPVAAAAPTTTEASKPKRMNAAQRRASVHYRTIGHSVLSLKLFLCAFGDTKRIDYAGVVDRLGLKEAFLEAYTGNEFPDNFPAIYIRDKSVDVFYELENYTEVTDGAVLRLHMPQSAQRNSAAVEERLNAMQKTLDEVLKHVSTKPVAPPLPAAPPPATPAPPPTATPATTSSSSVQQVAKVNIAPALAEVDRVRRQVAVLRQTYRDQHKSAMATMSATFTQLSSTLKTVMGENAGHLFKRTQLGTRKDSHTARIDTLVQRITDTETLVNELTREVVVHKCKPDMKMMETLMTDLDRLDTDINGAKDTFDDLERAFKAVWAKELKNVVNEEAYFKTANDDLDDLDGQYDDLANTVKTLHQLIAVQATLPSRTRDFGVENLEDRKSAVGGILQEITMLAPDHEARLKRIEVIEHLRVKQREVSRASSPLLEFENELTSKGSALRKTGGVDEVERKRKIRDQEFFKSSGKPEA